MVEAKRFLTLLAIIVVALGFTCPLMAVSEKSNQATLRGLRGLGVLVERLPPEVEKEGLIWDQLQLEIELKLRAAGIKVLTREETLRAPGEPYLYININVNIAKTESEIYPYSIDALLLQKVSLLRDPKLTTYAMTWSTGGVGSISKELLNQLRSSVEDIVDVFIRAYRAENPK